MVQSGLLATREQSTTTHILMWSGHLARWPTRAVSHSAMPQTRVMSAEGDEMSCSFRMDLVDCDWRPGLESNQHLPRDVRVLYH